MRLVFGVMSGHCIVDIDQKMVTRLCGSLTTMPMNYLRVYIYEIWSKFLCILIIQNCHVSMSRHDTRYRSEENTPIVINYLTIISMILMMIRFSIPKTKKVLFHFPDFRDFVLFVANFVVVIYALSRKV